VETCEFIGGCREVEKILLKRTQGTAVPGGGGALTSGVKNGIPTLRAHFRSVPAKSAGRPAASPTKKDVDLSACLAFRDRERKLSGD
jgi:hypothetical protein